MNILLLGSGGREHAIAWKIAQSQKVDTLFIAPGNAGTAQVGTNVNIKADDFEAIKSFVLDNQVNMVVVGPEDPLGGCAIGGKQRLCQGIHAAPSYPDRTL